MAIELIAVPADSPRDREIIALRTRVLREPLGLKFTEEQLAAEAHQQRLAAIVDGTLAACILLVPQDRLVMKFRQMAVDPGYQGQGLGMTLLNYAEAVARSNHYTSVALHARETAIGFYQRAGYQTIGDSFIEVTIPHRKMVKQF